MQPMRVTVTGLAAALSSRMADLAVGQKKYNEQRPIQASGSKCGENTARAIGGAKKKK